MKFKLLIFCVFIITIKSFSQIDSVFLYNTDSTKQFWYYQQDVYAFHLINDEIYNANDTIIDNVEYFKNNTVNVVKFKNSSTTPQRDLFIQNIQNQSNFDYECYTVTINKNSINDHTKREYNVTYPSLIVSFYENRVDSLIIDSFAKRNNITMTHSPHSSLSNQFAWSFIFSIDSIQLDSNFIKCQNIFENESIVKSIAPNMSMFYDTEPQPPFEFEIELSIDDISTDVISLYPNPTSGQLMIIRNSTKINAFSIINSVGRTIYRDKLRLNETIINLDKLSIPKGIYFIKFDDQLSNSKRIIYH